MLRAQAEYDNVTFAKDAATDGVKVVVAAKEPRNKALLGKVRQKIKKRLSA